jgi:hypothetical protein
VIACPHKIRQAETVRPESCRVAGHGRKTATKRALKDFFRTNFVKAVLMAVEFPKLIIAAATGTLRQGDREHLSGRLIPFG